MYLRTAPTPVISVTTDPFVPLEGGFFSASCVVSTSSDLVDYLSVNWTRTSDIPIDFSRVTVSPLRIINSSHVSLDAFFGTLRISDTGYYTCEAVVSGQYLSEVSSALTLFLDVQSEFYSQFYCFLSLVLQ